MAPNFGNYEVHTIMSMWIAIVTWGKIELPLCGSKKEFSFKMGDS
jgi:hypothetical protein